MSDNTVIFTRTISGLAPLPGPAQEWLRKVKIGSTVSVEKPKQPRNGQQLRLYWAVLSLVHQNLPEGVTYASVEDLSDALKIAVGHCRIIELPGGKVERIPKSISYKEMPQGKFDSFLTAVINKVIEHWLPGVTEEEIRQQAEQMLGLGWMRGAA